MESNIEKYLVAQTEKRGGWCRKLKAEMFTGWPDRTLYLPGGKSYLVETKYENKGELSPRQKYVIAELLKLGTIVHVITTIEAVDQFFGLVDAEII